MAAWPSIPGELDRPVSSDGGSRPQVSGWVPEYAAVLFLCGHN
jgi:hypothetical protein